MRFDKEQFVEDIKFKRKVEAMGLRTAAKQIGISFTHVKRIENYANPGIDNFAKICEWLNHKVTRYFKK